VSDYFGALIRSSSLAVGTAGSPPDRSVRLQPDASSGTDAPPVSSDIIELHEERTAPAVDPHPRAQAPEPMAAASTGRVAAHAHPADVATPSVNTAAAVTSDSPPPVAIARPRHEPANEESIRESARRDPDPVRLAMQWVAADPASRIIGAQPSLENATPETESLRRHESVVFTEPPQVMTERVTVEAPPRGRANESVREGAIATTVLTPAPTRAISEHVERATAASPIALPHEEVVEISIGAITLHVEAPAPQTVVQAAPPVPSHPARERAARSGLSRRYLRSF
jgi:hypothetical protein